MKNKKQRSAEDVGELVEKIDASGNGRHARRLVNFFAKHYSENPEALREYFSHQNSYVQGIATAVYANLTEDLDPALSVERGAWGATLYCTRPSLKVSGKQMAYAYLGGVSLPYSEISEGACKNAIFSQYAGRRAKIYGEACRGAEFSGRSIERTVIFGMAGNRAKFLEYSGKGATLGGLSSREAEFQDDSLIGARFVAGAGSRAKALGNSCRDASLENATFYRGTASDNSFYGAKVLGGVVDKTLLNPEDSSNGTQVVGNRKYDCPCEEMVIQDRSFANSFVEGNSFYLSQARDNSFEGATVDGELAFGDSILNENLTKILSLNNKANENLK